MMARCPHLQHIVAMSSIHRGKVFLALIMKKISLFFTSLRLAKILLLIKFSATYYS
jgi:hypothetical protein